MSKYKNINSSIIYYVLMITLDVSSISTHTHLLVLIIYYSIIRLYCLQPISEHIIDHLVDSLNVWICLNMLYVEI